MIEGAGFEIEEASYGAPGTYAEYTCVQRNSIEGSIYLSMPSSSPIFGIDSPEER
jgi:hypothetical protein